MRNLKTIAIILASLSPLLILIDIFCRIYYFGNEGLLMAVNDPGKVFFHLVLLPVIIFCLVYYAPYESMKKIIKKKGHFLLLVSMIAILFGVGTYQNLLDLHEGFCRRPPTPADFKDDSIRTVLINSWEIQHKQFRELNRTKYKDSALAVVYGKLDTAYLLDVKKVLEKYPNCKVKTGAGIMHCNYFKLTSFSANVDALLTYLAILSGVFLALILLTFTLTKTPLTIQQSAAIQVIIIFAIAWFPLRKYSEWYIHSGNDSTQGYSQFFLASAFIAALFFSYFVLDKKKVRQSFDDFKLGAGIVGAIFNCTLVVRNDWFTTISSYIVKQDPSIWIAIYVFAIFLVVVFVYTSVIHAQEAVDLEKAREIIINNDFIIQYTDNSTNISVTNSNVGVVGGNNYGNISIGSTTPNATPDTATNNNNTQQVNASKLSSDLKVLKVSLEKKNANAIDIALVTKAQEEAAKGNVSEVMRALAKSSRDVGKTITEQFVPVLTSLVGNSAQ